MSEWKLSEAFPQLPWADEADQFCFRILEEKTTIFEQLAACRIAKVAAHHGVCLGIITARKSSFEIRINIYRDLFEQMYTLGHEIGHTFHLDPDTHHSFERFPSVAAQPGIDSLVEDFCDAFSMKWVDANDWQKVMSFIEQIE